MTTHDDMNSGAGDASAAAQETTTMDPTATATGKVLPFPAAGGVDAAELRRRKRHAVIFFAALAMLLIWLLGGGAGRSAAA